MSEAKAGRKLARTRQTAQRLAVGMTIVHLLVPNIPASQICSLSTALNYACVRLGRRDFRGQLLRQSSHNEMCRRFGLADLVDGLESFDELGADLLFLHGAKLG